MSELKTKPTKESVIDFLNKVEPPEKRIDAFALLEIFQKTTGEKAVMWGSSIVGFGMYHYKSQRSTQEGDWPLVSFSPRKQNFTLYILMGNTDTQKELDSLGIYKSSGSCLYIKKLADVNTKMLASLILSAYQYMKKQNPMNTTSTMP